MRTCCGPRQVADLSSSGNDDAIRLQLRAAAKCVWRMSQTLATPCAANIVSPRRDALWAVPIRYRERSQRVLERGSIYCSVRSSTDADVFLRVGVKDAADAARACIVHHSAPTVHHRNQPCPCRCARSRSDARACSDASRPRLALRRGARALGRHERAACVAARVRGDPNV